MTSKHHFSHTVYNTECGAELTIDIDVNAALNRSERSVTIRVGDVQMDIKQYQLREFAELFRSAVECFKGVDQ